MLKEKRIGTTLIVIESKEEIHRLNTLISEFSYLIIGRQGIPLRENNKSIISLVLEGEEDQIGALSGQIGRLNGITVKTALVRRS